jgi:hypothetical protein
VEAHDEALHHFRRYEYQGLRRVLHGAGFRRAASLVRHELDAADGLAVASPDFCRSSRVARETPSVIPKARFFLPCRPP